MNLLPTKVEEDKFMEYVEPYLVPALPQYEVVISGVVTKRQNHLKCSMGVFNGLFDEQGFDQTMVQDQCRECPIDGDDLHLFADHVIETLYDYHAISDKTKEIRLAVDKFVNEDGERRYTKYLDLNIELIRSKRDLKILHQIVYFLLRYSAAGKYLVQSKRRHIDASEIWTLFPEQAGRSSLSAPI